MEILLDTHIILWTITDDPRLTYKAKELILNPENIIYYSVVCRINFDFTLEIFWIMHLRIGHYNLFEIQQRKVVVLTTVLTKN